MIELIDTFNSVVISRHRTLLAAVRAQRKHLAAVRRHNGDNAYITYGFRREGGGWCRSDDIGDANHELDCLVYEWDVERLADVGDGVFDIVDHEFSDSCPSHALSVCEQLVLVRDVIGEHGVEDRQWAYVDGGKLPATFSGGAKVPARFHAELAKARP